MWFKYLLNVWTDFKLPLSVSVMVTLMSDRIFIFCCKFTIKIFRTPVDTGSLKFLHTLFDPQLDHMLAKFEPIRTVRNLFKKNWAFDKKKSFLPFLTKFWRHLALVSHQTVVASVYPHLPYSLEELPWLARVLLSQIFRNRSYNWHASRDRTIWNSRFSFSR